MASVRFVEGVQCKRCGDFIDTVRTNTSELCQNCGARIIEKDMSDNSYSVTDNAKSVTVKVTSRFFKETLEIVE